MGNFLGLISSIALDLLKCYAIYVLFIIFWKAYLCLKNHAISKLWKVDLKSRFGDWAVVTGCTDGIGKAYCHEFAKRGINLILISRTLSKLEDVASDIKTKYGVETEIIQADFSKGTKVYEAVDKKLRGRRNIGILVNNVGVITDKPKSFEFVSEEEIWGHLVVNMGAPTYMTSIILPSMLANKKGAIINLSSISAMHPNPYIGIYAASKAFNYYFSESLRAEMDQNNIYVQTLTPYYVTTGMVQYSEKLSQPSLMVPTPEKFASEAVSTIGYANVTCGYYMHELFSIVFYILPERLKIKMATNYQKNLIAKMRKK